MQTVPQTTYGRKAYGAHCVMSAQVKARHVAASIATREQEGRPRTFADYGLTADSEQAALVLAQLPRVRPQTA